MRAQEETDGGVEDPFHNTVKHKGTQGCDHLKKKVRNGVVLRETVMRSDGMSPDQAVNTWLMGCACPIHIIDRSLPYPFGGCNLSVAVGLEMFAVSVTKDLCGDGVRVCVDGVYQVFTSCAIWGGVQLYLLPKALKLAMGVRTVVGVLSDTAPHCADCTATSYLPC